MRSVEDKEISSSSSISFEFHKGSGSNRSASRAALGKSKATPSKWDDAQKWLVGLSRDKNSSTKATSKPRNSNADDTRLIAPAVPHQENGYSSGEDEELGIPGGATAVCYPYEAETKNVDCEEGYWEENKAVVDASNGVRSVCVRDMGTEMTPIASLEPSRTATPIRATTPVRRSPIASGASTPMRVAAPPPPPPPPPASAATATATTMVVDGDGNGDEREDGSRVVQGVNELGKKMNPLETRAMAWDEAERAKYMARFKREEVKIQAWENHEKRKAEMEMKKMEVKAERLKARAQEKYTNKIASTRRIAEEKRANAEAKLNEKAVKTSEKADYIRRTGHLPSTLFKCPSFCW